MEKDKAKVIEIVGTASERAGSFVGKATVLGKKIAGVAAGGVSAGKGMLGLADEDTKPASERKSNSTKAVALKSDLVAAQQKLAQMQKEAQKTQSQLESQIETLQRKNNSLVSELEQAVSKVKEITASEGAVRARVAALESELDVAQQQLEQAKSKADNTKGKKPASTGSKAKLASDLTATRRKLEELRSQAESAQAQLTSQLEKLQLEKDSLISKVQTARKEADETKSREDVMRTKAAGLESDITALRSELAGARESKSDNNVIHAEKQTGLSEAAEEVKETATAPVGPEGVESSMEVIAQGEPIDVNVENVEEPELKSEAEAKAEVEATESAEVTLEQVQAADFKNGTDRIIFTKALSDFSSQKATARADAAATIAGIRHDLSPRLLITHMADEPSAYVRQECIKALTTLESKDGLSTIERALADEAASVRLAAVWGLYRLAGAESIPALTHMLSDDDEGVRRRAITCIGWLGGQAGKGGNHHSHKVVSALIQCLNDRSESIKNAALDTLETVTGKKMSAPRTLPGRLIEQWQKWWKSELLG